MPHEAVLATIEVESRLTNEILKTPVKNAWSVKTLSFDSPNLFSRSRQLVETRDAVDIHSPICAIFAFDSDISIKRGSHELGRLLRMVDDYNSAIEQNGIGVAHITVPISLLCVAKSINVECRNVEAPGDEASWLVTLNRDNTCANIVRFITQLVDTCTVYSYERDALLLDSHVRPRSQ